MQKRFVSTMIVSVALAACGGHSASGAQAVAHTSPIAAASPTAMTTPPTTAASPTAKTAPPTTAASPTAKTTPTTAASPAASMTPPITLTAKLVPGSGSKVGGTAIVTTSGSTFTVRLEATGLRPSSTHPAHIHAGTCGSNGPIVYLLENLVSNGAGDAVSNTWIHHPYQVPASGWYVQIHQGPSMSGTGATHIACAQLRAH